MKLQFLATLAVFGSIGCSKNKAVSGPEDRAPVAEILAPDSSETLYSDLPLDFVVRVLDLEDGAEDMDVHWESDIQGRLSVDMSVTGETELTGDGRLDEGRHLLQVLVRDSAENLATDQVVVDVGPPNSAPTCEIINPADGSVGNPGEMVSLMAAVADVDVSADLLSIEWASTQDGTLGSSSVGSDGTTVMPISTLTPGTHTIQLVARDELGAMCSDLVVYTVGSGPEIVILSPVDGAIVDEGASIEFSGLVSDSIDPPPDLRIQWRSDADGLLNELPPDSDGTLDFQLDELTVGFHTITLFAINTEGMANDETVTLRVNGVPTQPTVIISPAEPTSSEDLTALITDISTDVDGEAIAYRYTWYRNGAVFADGSEAIIPKDSTTKGDVWRVVLTPSDGISDGTPGEAEAFVLNTPPQLVDVSISPDPAVTADDFLCTPTGEFDWDGDAVTLNYSWHIGGEVVAVTTPTLPSAWTHSGDDVYCEVTPTDGFTVGDAYRSNIVTIENSAPHVVTVWINPDSVRAGDEPECQWSGFSDPDGDEDESIVTWYVNDLLRSSGPTADGRFVRGDTLSCTVTPSDGRLEGEPVTATIEVLNTAPIYESIEMTPRPADVHDTIHCTGWGYYDADADPDTSYIIWDINGGVWGISGSISDAFSGGDVVTCTLVPYDGFDEGAAFTQTQTIGNTSPSIETVTITPTAPSASDMLYCSHTGWFDADGDEDGTWYSWYRNDELLGVYSYWLTSGYTSAGDIISCRATPWDGTPGGSGTALTAMVVVSNSLPTVTAHLSPGVVRTDDRVRVIPSTFDSDGDLVSLSYQWMVNDSYVGSDSIELDGALWFSKGDSVEVYITPSDGTGSGPVYAAGPVTVANSDPEGLEVTIVPEAPDEGEDDLRCTLDSLATDVDGDPIDYEVRWYRDGILVETGLSSATMDGDTVDAAETIGGDEWTCEVTATDDDGGEVEATDTVFIAGWVGRVEDLPGLSCREVLDNYPTAPDGVYFLRPLDETFQAYCDMTTDEGGWTLVAYAPSNFGVPSGWTSSLVVDRAACVVMGAFCRFSDEEINAILDHGWGVDDRLRLVAPGLPHHDRYYWDTALGFISGTFPSTGPWWRVATSYGGTHSPGCAPSDGRGFGHEPTAGGCSASSTFGASATDRVYFSSSDGLSVGGAVDTAYSWYAQ